MTLWWVGNFSFLPDIYDNVFSLDSPLNFAHLWVVASTPKKAGRFNSKVAYLLFVAIDDRVAILFGYFVVGLFNLLLFFFRQVFADLRLFFEVFVDLCEVTFGQFFDCLLLVFGHELLPVFEEILVKNLLLGVVVFNHFAVKCGHFFALRAQFHRAAVIPKLDMLRERFIRRGKDWTLMFKCSPLLLRVVVIQLFPPLPDMFGLLFDLFLSG